MRLFPRIGLGIVTALVATCLLHANPAGAFSVTLHSGNGPAGGPDALVRRLNFPGACGNGFAAPFTPPDFAAADAGPPAIVLTFVHPAWGQTLPCDATAQWIGNDPVATPTSALYAIDFDLPDPCCLSSAKLGMCWMADDDLGDAVNPAGVYLNGIALPITGGNYATQTIVGGVDVLADLKCGKNTIYIYNRDLACAVSGINFLVNIAGEECVTPSHPSSWGHVKGTYR
jgi:hypothetical protein